MQRSDGDFERCYAADFDARVDRDARRACWSTWLAEKGTEQAPHRLTYARDRLAALERGEDQESLPGFPAAEEHTSGTEAVFENAGVDIARSELSVAETVAAGEGDAGVAPAPEVRPSDAPSFGNPACGRVCDPRWADCQARCDAQHGAACDTACVVEHRTCMRGCF